MSKNSKYWIVTDLDGTLMDENYDISPARKTLNLLSELNIPVIPCTSKTASEVRYFRKQNGLTDPFIVENGAAVYGTNENNSSEWELILGIIALASMTVGNLAAISQNDIGRMLAYSSIAQAGYIMIAIPAITEEAMSGAIAHTLVHAFMKGGAFVVVGCVGAVGLGYSLDSYKGLAKRSQLLALAMTVCLLSLVGIPPFAGFISKFF